MTDSPAADLFNAPLAGRASVTWRDGSVAECRSLADLEEVGLPAVVSLTEHADLVSRDELLDLMPVAIRCQMIEFIVVTKQWFDTGNSVIRPIRKLASLQTVSLGMICDHDTGLVNVKGAGLCWDYAAGTPRKVLSAKSSSGERVEIKQHGFIGPRDWMARAKAARAIHPQAVWHDFTE